MLAFAVALASLVTAQAPEPEVPSGWTGTLGVGLISLTGNAQSFTVSLNGAGEKKSEQWIVGAKARSAYGVARPAARDQPSQVVALVAAGELRTDYRATERVTGYLKVGLESDHVKSLELRAFTEAGSGLLWLERKDESLVTLSLTTDLALRVWHEWRYQYYPAPEKVPDTSLVAPRVAFFLRYAPSKSLLLTEDGELLVNLLGDGRILVNSTSKIALRLTDSLSLGVSFVVNHDSAPAPGKVPTDTALVVGLELAL